MARRKGTNAFTVSGAEPHAAARTSLSFNRGDILIETDEPREFADLLDEPVRCGCFRTSDGAVCTKESDHSGRHTFDPRIKHKPL